MTVLVLGGAGFIGSSVVETLLKNGFNVKVFEREGAIPYRLFNKKDHIEWFTGDFTNKEDLLKSMDGCSSIIHLISTTVPGLSNENPIHDIETNLIPTVRLLETMKEKNIKKIIFSSSGGTVYGEPIYSPIDEKHPTNPIVSYGIVKLAIEKYILMFSKIYKLDPIILRISNPFGDNQNIKKNQGLIGVLKKCIIDDEFFCIWGDGKNIRDYIHIDDVANAFLKSVYYQGDQKIFNISSGIGYSINDVIDIVEHKFQQKIKIKFLPDRGFDLKKNILCCDLAETELNWNSKKTLENYISLM